ncbi:MAG TPA: hypothetical protein VGG74_13830 [Kofleriaceae bacterium]
MRDMAPCAHERIDSGGRVQRARVRRRSEQRRDRVFAAGNGMCCLAYPSGELIWQTKSYVSRTATFMKSGDRLFAAINGEVECYSALDGKSLWTNKFRGKGSDVVALGTPSSVTQADRF